MGLRRSVVLHNFQVQEMGPSALTVLCVRLLCHVVAGPSSCLSDV